MAWYNSWKDLRGDISKGAEDVGKAGKAVGHTVGEVASNPWVQAATAALLAGTGVGAPAAAAIMAAEKGGGALLKPGGNLGNAVEQGAVGALEGGAASKLGSLVRGGIGALTSGASGAGSAGGPGASPTPTLSGGPGSAVEQGGLSGFTPDGAMTTDTSAAGGVGGPSATPSTTPTGAASGQQSGGLTGFLKGAGKVASSALGNQSTIDKLLSLASTYAAMSNQKRVEGLQNKAEQDAEGAYNQTAPLRTAGIAGMQAPARPNLGYLTAGSADPYSSRYNGAGVP